MSKAKPLSYHATKFSEKVRVMNDSNSRSLLLTSEEARSLHTDIFAMLAKIAELSTKPEPVESSVIQDGGKFR